jgi:hypothetical protein
MKPRFDELLPFYANGTLTGEDRAFVESWLREHPSARAELQWYETLQQRLRADVPAVSSEIGLERTMQRIRNERAAAAPAAPARPAPSPFERLRGWLATLVPQPMLKPAFGAALAVVVIQAGVIGSLLANHEEASEMRAIKPAPGVVEQGPYLKLNFRPEAREADIRMLLVQIHGALAAGPGQLGDYYVRVIGADPQALLAQVAASPVVESASVVDGLPER